MRQIYSMLTPVLTPVLTYAGAIPFVFCAGSIAFDFTIPPFDSTQQILIVYALLIASFMTGVHWGQHLHINSNIPLAILSNSNAVLLWIGFLLLPFKLLLTLFALSFVFLLAIDKKLYEAGIISLAYFKTRVIVTIIVVVSLLVAGLTS